MFDALKSIGRPWRRKGDVFPTYGLARIQWEGPWTKPGVPMAARYRHTHWVGVAQIIDNTIGIFDVNACGNGTGWCSLADWSGILVPWILKECEPKAHGGWHVTHGIEVGR